MAQNQNVNIKATVSVDDAQVKKYNETLDQTEKKTEAAFNPKRALKEATIELQKAQAQFGEYSKEALAAAKRVAQLRDSIQEANETAALFDPGKKFAAFSGALNSVAAGYGAVQGAIGLLGVESEETQKQLLKVQSALAVSEGLSSILDSGKDFQRLGAIIKTQVVTAFTTLKGAIAATGIGALTIGLGLLIANWDKVKKAVLDAVPGLIKAGEAISKIINRITDFIGVTSEAGRQTAKLIRDNEKAIKDGNRFLDLEGDKYDEYTQRKIKANLEFKKRQNEFLNDEKLTEAQRNKFIQDARDKANREIIKSDKDREQALSDARKKAADEAKAEAEKRQREAKERREKLEKEEAEAFKRRKELADNNIKDIDALNSKNAENQSINIKQQINNENAIQSLIPKRIEVVTKVAQSEEQLAKIKRDTAAAEIILEDKKQAQFQDNAAKTAEGLGFIANAFGKQTAVGKAAAISEATINTYLGAQKAYASLSGIPIVGPGLGIAAAAAAIIAGLKNVREISKTKTPGGAVGGSVPSISAPTAAAPLAPTPQQAITTQLDQQSINQLNTASMTTRAYVVESDVSSSQDRIRNINRAATFG